MKNHDKLEKLKVILILVFITSFFFVSLIYVFLKDVPILISFLEKYFSSGNSFFFPIIPNINLFWFLPEEYQIIRLTIGQLIDIFIIINIIIHIDSSFYHYVKNVCLNNDTMTFTFLDLYIRNSAVLQTQSQEPENLMEGEDWLYDHKILSNIQVNKKMSLKKRIFGFYRSNFIKNHSNHMKQYKKLKLKSNSFNISLPDFYHYYSAFILFSIIHLRNRSFPLDARLSPNINVAVSCRETEMKITCYSSDFENLLFLFKLINNQFIKLNSKKKNW